MHVEQWPIERPQPYAKNARVIPQKAIDKVAASIKSFGWRQPIVVDEQDVIVIGHTRYKAAHQLGLTEVPVHVARGLTPAQVRALRLADNRTHDETSWNLDLLLPELGELRGLEIDLSSAGFDPHQINRLFRNQHGSEDDTPEAPVDPVTKLGTLWDLGGHRLLCGDSTKAEDVARVMVGKPRLMVTDPPYGVDYDPDWRLRDGLNKSWQTRAEGKVSNDDRADWQAAWALFPGSIAYVWHGSLHSATAFQSLSRAGFEIRSQIVWVKSALVIGRGHYHWQHEPCWYAVRDTANWQGDRKQSTVWQIATMHRTQGDVDDGKTSHSTQKPVECMRRPILNHTSPGEAVYDPFLGSGTTLIAAELTERLCYGIEIEPAYCDMIVSRWEKITGKKATPLC